MLEKIWDRHVVREGSGDWSLLYIDRHLLHEGASAAFERLAKSGRTVRRPGASVATADHYVATTPGDWRASEPEMRQMVERLAESAPRQHITHFGVGDARRGILAVEGEDVVLRDRAPVHVVGIRQVGPALDPRE